MDKVDGMKWGSVVRGVRLPANRIKVQLGKNAQFSITLPSLMARALNIQRGDVVEFVLVKDGLKIRKVLGENNL
jgi:hypothetical protein